ncbi:MAG: intradiol ring-cleavage dioxygenase [Hyphomicrobiaceae bacterium]|nr:intradiol ring-cleavage dioxygenase [Hyphomicrobiaceae bacterium]
MRPDMNRRRLIGGLIAGAAGSGMPSGARAQPAVDGALRPAAAQPDGVCVLFPQAVEGPFYFDPDMVRADITEGSPGLPLRFVLRVIELGACKPIADARVDVWHADAGGVYSGYSGQGDDGSVSAKGRTHLRGTQFTDADGTASFTSVYPGWYPGRTPHIHLKVFLDARTVLTAQAYFPDETSARVYRSQAAYAARPVADTTNARDFIFRRSTREGGSIVFTMRETSALLEAALVIAVDRKASSAGWWNWLRG